MSMAGHDLSGSIRENYLAFARMARGRSRPYEILAAEVADDPSVRAFLAALPPAKRQGSIYETQSASKKSYFTRAA